MQSRAPSPRPVALETGPTTTTGSAGGGPGIRAPGAASRVVPNSSDRRSPGGRLRHSEPAALRGDTVIGSDAAMVRQRTCRRSGRRLSGAGPGAAL